MFENFPYTDMHQLNLDWIIKIAKDFLDQYTHIQELIANGEASLQNLTETGLQELQDKADALEALLNEWYTTHSNDIAEQLADALQDLNEWYTLHQNYLDETLQQNIQAFNTAAEAKAAETIASIPDDYTTLTQTVNSCFKPKTVISGSDISLTAYRESGWYGIAGSASITDLPTGYTMSNGLTLLVYNGTNASGGYIMQELIQGCNKFAYRVLGSSGTVIIPWTRAFETDRIYLAYMGELSETLTLSTITNTGWYSFSGGATFTDAPSGVLAASGVSMYVFEKNFATNGAYIIQFLVVSNGRIYFRFMRDNQTNISSWIRFTNESDIAETLHKNGTVDTNNTLASYTQSGWYGVPGGYTSDDTPPGYLANSGSTLYVMNSTAASGGFVTQIFIQGNPFRLWHRVITKQGATIAGYDWQETGVMARAIPVITKTVEWYGDSTVAGQGGNGTNFPSIVNVNLSMDGTNLSVSGRSVSTIRSSPTPMVQAFESEIILKDVLYFQGGTNDFWSSAPMGTIDSTNTATFYGALNTIMARLQTKFPSMCIILGTPFRVRHTPTSPETTYTLPEKNSLNLSLEDYCDAIKEIGKKYCIPVIDNYNECGINPENDAMLSTFMSDGVHMNATGYQKIAAYITNKMREYYSHS